MSSSPTAPSLVYRSALVYELIMRALYGRHYGARLRSVAGEVADGSSVLELCCGPGTLYKRHLAGRVGRYVGLDVNTGFVDQLIREGVEARVVDLSDNRPLPEADVVIMQASLYHFLPDARQVLERMLQAAADRVVISEPVRNLSTSAIPGLARVGRGAADPGVGGHGDRFTEATLDELMDGYRERILRSFLIPGGREKVYVLAGGPAPRAAG